MKVSGFISRHLCPAMTPSPTRALNLSLRILAPQSAATASRAWKPALWRVFSYSRPGFPSPARIHRMGPAAEFPPGSISKPSFLNVKRAVQMPAPPFSIPSAEVRSKTKERARPYGSQPGTPLPAAGFSFPGRMPGPAAESKGYGNMLPLKVPPVNSLFYWELPCSGLWLNCKDKLRS